MSKVSLVYREDITNLKVITNLKDAEIEKFYCVLITREKMIPLYYSSGNTNNTIAPTPEQIARVCGKFHARHLVFVHNHVNYGLMEQFLSVEDIKNFYYEKKILKYYYNIELLDSIVVTPKQNISLREMQYLL